MRKRHGFTLIELMIVLIVLAILAAIAIPIYQNQVEKTKADISAARLEARWEEWEITCMKNDESPTGMSRLRHKYGEDAFSIVQENKKNFMSDIFSLDSVYADGGGWPPSGEDAWDPSDPRGRSAGMSSYGINIDAVEEPEVPGRGRRWGEIRGDTNLAGPVPIIAEFDSTSGNSTFRGLAGVLRTRHKKGGVWFGLFINRDGVVYAIAKGATAAVEYKNWW